MNNVKTLNVNLARDGNTYTNIKYLFLEIIIRLVIMTSLSHKFYTAHDINFRIVNFENGIIKI